MILFISYFFWVVPLRFLLYFCHRCGFHESWQDILFEVTNQERNLVFGLSFCCRRGV